MSNIQIYCDPDEKENISTPANTQMNRSKLHISTLLNFFINLDKKGILDGKSTAKTPRRALSNITNATPASQLSRKLPNENSFLANIKTPNICRPLFTPKTPSHLSNEIDISGKRNIDIPFDGFDGKEDFDYILHPKKLKPNKYKPLPTYIEPKIEETINETEYTPPCEELDITNILKEIDSNILDLD